MYYGFIGKIYVFLLKVFHSMVDRRQEVKNLMVIILSYTNHQLLKLTNYLKSQIKGNYECTVYLRKYLFTVAYLSLVNH